MTDLCVKQGITCLNFEQYLQCQNIYQMYYVYKYL